MRNRIIALSVVAAMTAAACGGDTESAAPTGPAGPDGLAASAAARVDSGAPAGDIATAAAGNRAFAVDAYLGLLETNEGNLVFSPASIRLALAMTWAGAAGSTADQIASTLHLDLPADEMHAALNAIDSLLTSRNREEEPGPDEIERKVVLTISNALWGQAGFEFVDEFLDTLAINYGAGMRLVDFAEDTEGARVTINDWVADQTNDRITDLIPAGTLTALTRLVLTNAVYMDATWQMTFDGDDTVDQPFTTLAGSEAIVEMMHQEALFEYASGDGWQAIELPYVGRELAMLVVVPDHGRFDETEGALSTEFLDQIAGRLDPVLVNLGFPKWEFRTKASLADLLRSLGMTDAFGDRADFSAMTTEDELFVADVIHEAFIKVDEEGTEAAAATAVVMAARAALPSDAVELTVDRPFLFSLYDRETGTILFMGRVTDPTAE